MAKINPLLEQAYKSHLSVLLEAIKRTDKPILELGAGDGSTRQIHNATKGFITTIEDSKAWLNRFLDLQSARHRLLLLSEKEMIEKFFANDTTAWGLVFVDSATWVGRASAINKYKDTADYLVIHDTDYSVQTGVFGKTTESGKSDFSDTFKQWIEFIPTQKSALGQPPTVVGSNVRDLKDFTVQDMQIIGTNA